MIRRISLSGCLCALTLFVFTLVSLPGCTKGGDGKKDDSVKGKEKGKHDHAHPDSGPHGGPYAEWEELDYHVEFTVERAAKKVIVYVLGKDVKTAPKIDAAKITKVKLTVLGSTPLVAVDLTHDPKLSDDKGIAFTGTHDYFAKPADFKGEISGNVNDGKKDAPYKGDFEYKAPKNAQRFLTPGGIYTVADIKANGNTTPEEKFKGMTWKHEDKQPGDKICPITKNKAEAECAWIVQGQRYEFCCPPCLDKFMGWAHNDPKKIKNANEYVFKGM